MTEKYADGIRVVDCPECDGWGVEYCPHCDNEMGECPHCDGTGEVPAEDEP